MRMLLPIAPVGECFQRSSAYFKDGWKADELLQLLKQCDALPLEDAVVERGPGGSVRKSRIAWVPFEDATAWIYHKLRDQVWTLNHQCFRFDLAGFAERLQYSVYDAAQEEHYDWHVDQLGPGLPVRKLSFTLQLSSADSYSGGDLELEGRNPHCVDRALGTLHVFPSWIRHRVQPVTAGVRRALVGWVTGMDFR